MEQVEDGKEDHNVLAVIPGEAEHLDSRTKQMLTEFVSHVFDHVPEKAIRAGIFRGEEAALEYVSLHSDSIVDDSE